jgi:putative endopeptidase
MVKSIRKKQKNKKNKKINKTQKIFLPSKNMKFINLNEKLKHVKKEKFRKFGSEDSPLIKRLINKKNLDKWATLPKEIKYYKNYHNIIKKEFKKLRAQPKFQPKNDFYDFINYEWISSQTEKLIDDPKYYVQVDDFRVVQDKVYEQLISYVLEYIKQNKNTKKGKAVKAIYECVGNSSIKKAREHILNVKSTVEKYIEDSDMYGLLAYTNSSDINSWSSPLVWTILPDEKNVTKYISHLSPPQLGLYDYFIYIEDPKDDLKTKNFKKEFKSKYLEYITNVFKTVLPNKEDRKNFKAEDVWNVEVELLNAMGCIQVKKEDPDFYNLVSKQQLEKDYGFNWTLFCEKLGYKKENIPNKVICSSLNSVKCITELLKKKWSSDMWKTWWLFTWFKQMIRFDWNWNKVHFDFYGKFVKGQPIEMPKHLYPIFALSFAFNTLLSELYVENNANPINETFVSNMVEDLKFIFIKKLERNTWLSPSTKKAAIKKLKHLETIVGFPTDLREDPILDYENDDPWSNMWLLSLWKKRELIKLEGKGVIDIPEIDWSEFKLVGTQPYMVNAYYRPTSNSIYVPLAYLQKPFIDLEHRGIEYNLAYIGYTLGHELSHSLDDMGSKFDEKGNMVNWWTEKDKKIYQAKIRNVIKQYEEFAARDGIKFDAEIGVGENLADISGLALVEEYLFFFQIIHDDIALVKNLSFEAFYAYCAIQSRQKVYDKALPAQLKQNPHPLEKYRCNCPLSRFEIFRELYNVKKGDGMWWNNTDTIW